ncbi:hypothetical protein [Viridibacillus soli]|uniref:hypothetical protein n=1 Tax=Viridibacillus soli TaxID=2798301 RepID=UPI001F31F2E2|nr:hypothetical protein [Viridibacillus soli]
MHVSFANETGMPLRIVKMTGLKHDGPIGKQLEDKRFILVGDRAYFSIEKVVQYVKIIKIFAALIAYVLLKWLHVQIQKQIQR